MKKVKIYEINKGQVGHYFGVMHEDGTVFHYAPTWKTEKGAMNWINKKGYILVK